MYYLVIVIFIVVILIRFRHTKIKWKTFFRKGFAPRRGKFGVYCYCGKQGSGKTYSAVDFILQNKNMPIYSNVSSIKGVKYTYFSGFDELLKLRDQSDCIIFYDEIFTALTKTSRMTKEVLDFLSYSSPFCRLFSIQQCVIHSRSHTAVLTAPILLVFMFSLRKI